MGGDVPLGPLLVWPRLLPPQLPPAALADWIGPRWWRTVRAVSGQAAVQQPHPLKYWVRAAEASALAWAGDEAHELALARRGRAASRDSFVDGCARCTACRRCRGKVQCSARAYGSAPGIGFAAGRRRRKGFGFGPGSISQTSVLAAEVTFKAPTRSSRKRPFPSPHLCAREYLVRQRMPQTSARGGWRSPCNPLASLAYSDGCLCRSCWASGSGLARLRAWPVAPAARPAAPILRSWPAFAASLRAASAGMRRLRITSVPMRHPCAEATLIFSVSFQSCRMISIEYP